MESNPTAVTVNKRFHFGLLLPFLLHPGTTFPQIVQKRATWLTPLLVISVLIIARIMLATPTTTISPLPGEFIPEPGIPVPMGPKGQETEGNYALISARPQKGGGEGEGRELPPEATAGSMIGNLIPAVGATVSLWAGWFLLSVLLYVGMVISGSNNSFTETLNLTAWASLPLAIRQIVMLVAGLAAPSVTDGTPAGISALTSSLSGPAGMFATSLLQPVDIYLVWQIILIVIGLRQVSPLPARRVIGITLGAVALFLVLAALPGFFSAIFAQLTAPSPVNF